MEQQVFNVVFSGDVVAGETLETVCRRLATAFRSDVDKMTRLFRPEGSIVRRNVDRGTAEKYRDFLEKNGALCRVEEVIQEPPVEKAPQGEEPTSGSPEEPRVVTLKAGSAKLQYAPLRINRLSGVAGGIHLNRGDRGEVQFSDIQALSTLRDTKSVSGQASLIIFVRGGQRPYVVDANQISYGDFPDVRETGTDASLRKLLAFLFEQNPGILRDTETVLFVEAGGKVTAEGDLAAQATALAEALELSE